MKNVFAAAGKNSSVSIAKDRLKLLLISYRANCTPDTMEKLRDELYVTVSKYIEIAPDAFDVSVSQSDIFIKLTGVCE